MRSLIRRAGVAAGVTLVSLTSAVGVASATGTGALSWSPTTAPGTYSYGALTPGQTVSKTFTLTNSGSSATSVLKIALTGSSAFTKAGDTCTGTSLGPKKSCTVTVTYAPIAYGESDKATLTATSNKPSLTASLALVGAGAKVSPTITTTPSAGGPPGTAPIDSATLSGGSSPTGTIEFRLYGPSPTPDCTGTPVDHETATVNGDGTYYSSVVGLTLVQQGTYWWTATYSGDTANNQVASSCGDEKVTISPGATASLQVSGLSNGTAGASQTVTVTAVDAYGNTTPGYTGTVHFTSSDPQAQLPADYTFTAADNGTHTFSVTLKTAGSQSVTATDTTTASITGNQTVTVNPATAARFSFSSLGSTATVGTSTSFTLTALDAYGNVATGYTGTVHFTSSDPAATLPADYTFTAADNGTHTFSATFNTAGSQSITASDSTNPSITGTSDPVTVS